VVDVVLPVPLQGAYEEFDELMAAQGFDLQSVVREFLSGFSQSLNQSLRGSRNKDNNLVSVVRRKHSVWKKEEEAVKERSRWLPTMSTRNVQPRNIGSCRICVAIAADTGSRWHVDMNCRLLDVGLGIAA